MVSDLTVPVQTGLKKGLRHDKRRFYNTAPKAYFQPAERVQIPMNHGNGKPLKTPVSPSHQPRPVFPVDLGNLLFPVDIVPIQSLRRSPAQPAGRAVFTSAPAVQRTADDFFPFLAGRVFDQDAFHRISHLPFFRFRISVCVQSSLYRKSGGKSMRKNRFPKQRLPQIPYLRIE